MKYKITLFFILFIPVICKAFDYNLTDDLIQVDSDTVKPDVGVIFCDLDFNTTFYRVADAVADVSDDMAGIVYSRFSPLSYDGKYLFLQSPVGWNDGLLYNATSYEFIKRFPTETTIDGTPSQNFVTMEGSECRWRRDSSNVKQFYFVGNYNVMNGMALYCYDVEKDTATIIHDFSVNFPAQDHICNDVEGDSSRDSRYWTFMVFDPYAVSYFPLHAIITYDMVADVILGTMTVTEYQAAGGQYDYLPRPNMVDMSPSGRKMVMLMPRCWSPSERPDDIGGYFDGPHAWDLNFTNPIKVAADQAHSGWGYDHDGNEMWVSQNNRTDYFQATDIMTGTSFYFFSHVTIDYASVHFARMPSSDTLKGWCLASTYTSETTNNTWGDNQLLMFELVDMNVYTPVIWRLGHTWNYNTAYYDEGFAAMDDNGTDLWWNANWFDDTPTIEAYRMVLPDLWWTEIGAIKEDAPLTSGSTHWWIIGK